jgi:hypothetical protein
MASIFVVGAPLDGRSNNGMTDVTEACMAGAGRSDFRILGGLIKSVHLAT